MINEETEKKVKHQINHGRRADTPTVALDQLEPGAFP